MGRYGDTTALRSSAASYSVLADDLDAIRMALPQSIPSSAWSGRTARDFGENLPTFRAHLSRAIETCRSLSSELSKLASTLESIEWEEDNERGASIGALTLLTPDAINAANTEFDLSRHLEFQSRASTAIRAAANQLRALGNAVQLSQHIPYTPPLAQSLAPGAGGLSDKQKAIIAADAAGVVDPTPISDVTGAVLSFSDGDLGGGLLSLVGIVPIVGDSAKVLKHGDNIKYLRYGDEVAGGAKTIDRVVSGLDGIDMRAGYHRIPNHLFTDNGFMFRTDGVGRTVLVTGDLKKSPHPRSAAQTRIGKLGDATDQGGHLIGSRFGGPDSPANITPQARFINQRVYKELENEWADLRFGQNKDVNVTIRLEYSSPDTVRPDSFLIEYSVDGVEQPARILSNDQMVP